MKQTPPIHLEYKVHKNVSRKPFHSFLGAWMMIGIIMIVLSFALFSVYVLSEHKEIQLAPGDGSAYSYPGILTFRGAYENSTYRNGVLFGAIGLALFIVISLVVVFFLYRRESKEIAQIWKTE